MRALARRLGLNPKTVAKWKSRDDPYDRPPGRRPGQNRKLTAEEESIVIQFRKHTRLPLDDCLYALQAPIPHLTRSSLCRCLKRHGLGRPGPAGNATGLPERAAVKPGELHVDHAQVRSDQGTHFVFSAIEQASRFVFLSVGPTGDAEAASGFLVAIAQGSPLPIGVASAPAAQPFATGPGTGRFADACRDLRIRHCIRTDHDALPGPEAVLGNPATDPGIPYESEDHLVRVVHAFVHAYNFQRRLKSLGGKTPYEALCLLVSKMAQGPDRNGHHDLTKLEFMRR